MRKKTLIIHIGYPKTATTTLQVNVLNSLHLNNKINYLGNHELTNNNEVEATDLLIASMLFWRKYGVDIHSRLARDCAYLGGLLRDDVVNVWSSEYLSLPDFLNYRLIDMPNRLRQAFGTDEVDFKIIVTLREQVELISSFYSHFYEKWYFRNRNTDDINKFVDVLFKDQEKELSYVFDFERHIGIWEKEFGLENIYINYFEDVKGDIGRHLKDWSDLLAVNSHELSQLYNMKNPQRVRKRKGLKYQCEVSALNTVLKLLRKEKIDSDDKNKIIKRLFWAFIRRLPNRKIYCGEINKDNKKVIRNHFSESNERLADKFLLDKDRMREQRYFE